jgi:hypothetical protein
VGAFQGIEVTAMTAPTIKCAIAVVLVWILLPTPSRAQLAEPVFLGADDKPLPMQEVDEILAFLRSASEIASEDIGHGITQARRLSLEDRGIQMRAAFHHITRNERKVKRLPNDHVVAWVRDHYSGQVAAFRLGRMLGIHNIPPTVLRRSNGLKGSAQLWIENSMMEQERQEKGIKPTDRALWNQLYADMRVFDNLINNIDRNTGNMLVDSFGYLWLIDHTRSFGPDASLPRPETISRCSNRLYEAIQALDEAEVEAELRDLLARGEIKAIFKRRVKLLETIDQRIESLGRDQVLFDYGDPELGLKIVDGDSE